MTIHIIYITLLSLMLIVLFRSGVALRRDCKVMSAAGFSTIIAYTLNEGLRFGRGIDYNLYWKAYEQFEVGTISDKEYSFYYLQKLLISAHMPFQVLVLFMSFMFILGVLMLLRNYSQSLPLALPLFLLFSLNDVENLVRWYFACSFFFIGLSYLLKENILNWRYVVFSVIGCSFHYAFI